MNQLISGNITNVKMTSREIADLVESRHDKVKQSIERLVSKGVIQSPPMGNFKNINNVEGFEYVFVGLQGKRDSFVVVAQLSPVFTAALVDRWQQLEDGQVKLPQTLPEALRLAADLAEQNALLLPKAMVADQLVASDEEVNLTMAAKLLDIAPHKFTRELAARGWVYKRPGSRHWTAYQDKINSGYLYHKFNVYTKPDGSAGADPQVMLTTKGLAKLNQIFGRPTQAELLEAA